MPKRRARSANSDASRSKRWQAFYTGPDTALHYAPSTFDTKMDAEAWLVDERRIIASGAWVAPAERHHAAGHLDHPRQTTPGRGWPTGHSSRAPASTTKPCWISRSSRASATSR